MVSTILYRTVSKDISRYNAIDLSEDVQEDWGWKLVHGEASLSIEPEASAQADGRCTHPGLPPASQLAAPLCDGWEWSPARRHDCGHPRLCALRIPLALEPWIARDGPHYLLDVLRLVRKASELSLDRHQTLPLAISLYPSASLATSLPASTPPLRARTSASSAS